MHEQPVREHMLVLSSDGEVCGSVDGITHDELIQLTRDEFGFHHWIPMAWIERVDDKVHLGKNAADVQREWLQTPPGATGTSAMTRMGSVD